MDRLGGDSHRRSSADVAQGSWTSKEMPMGKKTRLAWYDGTGTFDILLTKRGSAGSPTFVLKQGGERDSTSK